MISDPPCAVGGRPLASATHGRRRPRPGAACAAFAPRRVPRGARGVLRARRRSVQAMERLAALAGASDAAEAPMLRAMARQFAAALGRGALGDAKAAAETVRGRSGRTVIPRRR